MLLTAEIVPRIWPTSAAPGLPARDGNSLCLVQARYDPNAWSFPPATLFGFFHISLLWLLRNETLYPPPVLSLERPHQFERGQPETAARVICGLAPRSEISNALVLARAGSQPLCTRRNIAQATFVRKLMLQRLPSHLLQALSDFLPSTSFPTALAHLSAFQAEVKTS